MTAPAPHEDVLRRVQQWVTLADEDLRLAEYAFHMPPPCPYRLIAYHCQQCAEKYLKAYLVAQNIDFPFTHNISALLELCEPTAPWVGRLLDAEALTSYAVTARYPGFEDEVDGSQVGRLLDIARSVRETLRAAFTNAGVKLN